MDQHRLSASSFKKNAFSTEDRFRLCFIIGVFSVAIESVASQNGHWECFQDRYISQFFKSIYRGRGPSITKLKQREIEAYSRHFFSKDIENREQEEDEEDATCVIFVFLHDIQELTPEAEIYYQTRTVSTDGIKVPFRRP